jgi:mannose-6-phosphate isomerase-like protein (cupin superfamily)
MPLLVAACTAHPPAPKFVAPGAGGEFVASAVAAAPLAADQNVSIRPMVEGAQTSTAVAQIRDREQLHIHTRYDLTWYLARGHGTLWLAGVAYPMHAGDAAFIPRGVPHGFINEGDEPAVTVVVFAPPFSGPDQAPVP